MASAAHGNFRPSSRGAPRIKFFAGQRPKPQAWKYTMDGRIGVSMEMKRGYAHVGIDLWRCNSDLTKRTQALLMQGWNRYASRLKRRTPSLWAKATATTFDAIIRKEHVEVWKVKLREILDRPCVLERHVRPFIQERRIGAKG